jgi:hypothetical protein
LREREKRRVQKSLVIKGGGKCFRAAAGKVPSVRWPFVFFEALSLEGDASMDGQVGFYVSGP